jgi:hypothetical protein
VSAEGASAKGPPHITTVLELLIMGEEKRVLGESRASPAVKPVAPSTGNAKKNRSAGRDGYSTPRIRRAPRFRLRLSTGLPPMSVGNILERPWTVGRQQKNSVLA